ncbi:MAG: DHH family phosphoesterase [Ardenticatenia bacterium]|nr:DHH family phosphoesterase [Ardenticatenia bacterium]
MSSQQAVAEALHQARSVLILSHTNPDGDAVGSALGLMWALRSLRLRAHVALPDPVPANLTFLPGANSVGGQELVDDQDVCVVLDSSSPQHVGDLFEYATARECRVINVDHHVTNVRFGHVNWINPACPAVAQMIYWLLPLLGVSPDPKIATCLLTGFVTDTNGFSTPNTTPRLLHDAAELVTAGAPLADIIREAHLNRSLAQVRLWAQALQSLCFEDGIVWTVNTPAMRRAAGATERDSSGLSTFLLTIREAHMAASFTVLDDGRIRVSLRARPGYDVAAVAARFGGGGHPPAAGATLDGPLDEAVTLVISAMKAQVADYSATVEQP